MRLLYQCACGRRLNDNWSQDLGRSHKDSSKRGPQTPGKGAGPAKLYGLGVTFKKSDGEQLTSKQSLILIVTVTF